MHIRNYPMTGHRLSPAFIPRFRAILSTGVIRTATLLRRLPELRLAVPREELG
jgi:hypothetical protein